MKISSQPPRSSSPSKGPESANRSRINIDEFLESLTGLEKVMLMDHLALDPNDIRGYIALRERYKSDSSEALDSPYDQFVYKLQELATAYRCPSELIRDMLVVRMVNADPSFDVSRLENPAPYVETSQAVRSEVVEAVCPYANTVSSNPPVDVEPTPVLIPSEPVPTPPASAPPVSAPGASDERTSVTRTREQEIAEREERFLGEISGWIRGLSKEQQSALLELVKRDPSKTTDRENTVLAARYGSNYLALEGSLNSLAGRSNLSRQKIRALVWVMLDDTEVLSREVPTVSGILSLHPSWTTLCQEEEATQRRSRIFGNWRKR